MLFENALKILVSVNKAQKPVTALSALNNK